MQQNNSHPGGMVPISRGLSVATPPESGHGATSATPAGVTAAGRISCDPYRGRRFLARIRSLRAAAGSTAPLVFAPSGCAADNSPRRHDQPAGASPRFAREPDASACRLICHTPTPRFPRVIAKPGISNLARRRRTRFTTAHRHRSRRGLSLLEVLISIFVLSVGLLYLLTLVPVGRLQVADAVKADTAAVLGDAAQSEIELRDWLDTGFWVTRTGVAPGSVAGGGMAPPTVRTFCIDPLGLAINSSDSDYDWFPASSTTGYPRIPRITISTSDTTALPITQPVAELIFRGSDDLVFEFPDDKDQRPIIVKDSSGNAFPRHITAQANYSWLFTVAPQLDASGSTLTNLHTVSAVVFYKREFIVDNSGTTSPSERLATLNVLSGIGGVEARLVSNVPTDAKAAKEYFGLRRNQWVMLCGGQGGVPIHLWYRVVAASEPYSPGGSWSGDATVDVSLAGPDWDTTTLTANNAILCDRIIGVFEKTVKLDEPSLWSAH